MICEKCGEAFLQDEDKPVLCDPCAEKAFLSAWAGNVKGFEDVANDAFDEPEEGDYTTEDHGRFCQFGKLAVVVDEIEEWPHMLKAHMDREQFWPNVWFVSDHGNAHLIDMFDALAEADERSGADQ